MKIRFLTFTILFAISNICISQSNRAIIKADYIKVWGVLKYYSPIIQRGDIDWDNILLRHHEQFSEDLSLEKYNSYISILIDTIHQKTKIVENLTDEDLYLFKNNRIYELESFNFLKDSIKYVRKPDFSWIVEDSMLTSENRTKLLEIIINYNPSKNNIHLKTIRKHIIQPTELEFENISTAINNGTEVFVPYEYNFLALARFWNVINYLYPYKNLLSENWDSFLIRNCESYNEIQYFKYVNSFAVSLQEGHARINKSNVKTPSGLTNPDYVKFQFPFKVKLIDDKIFINGIYDTLNANNAIVKNGDEILYVDNESTNDILTRLRSQISHGNSSYFKSFVESNFSYYVYTDSIVSLTIKREFDTLNILTYGISIGKFKNEKKNKPNFIEIDSSTIYLSCATPSLEFAEYLSNSYNKDIILDLRDLPVGENMNLLCNFLSNEKVAVAKYDYPNIQYPGVFEQSKDLEFMEKIPLPLKLILPKETRKVFKFSRKHFVQQEYNKNLIVLIHGYTISSMETLCMMIRKVYPSAIFIGRPTAGSNGDIVSLTLPGNVSMSYSSINFHFADGTQTQKIGHQPDILIQDKVEYLKNGNSDPILEAAVLFLQK